MSTYDQTSEPMKSYGDTATLPNNIGRSEAITRERSVIEAEQFTQVQLLDELHSLVTTLREKLTPVSTENEAKLAGEDNEYRGRSRVYADLYESNQSIRGLQRRVATIIYELEI